MNANGLDVEAAIRTAQLLLKQLNEQTFDDPIEPSSLPLLDILPQDLVMSNTWYLGYGRNAWHSTWINRYYPKCISFSIETLKKEAEKRRTQGTVFRIQSYRLRLIDSLEGIPGQRRWD
jgi:hypothetical protein